MSLKLAVITVSTRPGRVGPAIAEWFVGQARADAGFEVVPVDLAEVALSVPSVEPAAPQPAPPEPPSEDDGPEPSFWTPRNSTCDPWWRRMLDRILSAARRSG